MPSWRFWISARVLSRAGSGSWAAGALQYRVAGERATHIAGLPPGVGGADDVDAHVPCFFGRDPDGNVVNMLSLR